MFLHSMVIQALLIRPFRFSSRFVRVRKAVESPIRVVVPNPFGACPVSSWERWWRLFQYQEMISLDCELMIIGLS